MSEAHGGAVSEGGNEDKLREIYRERLELEKAKLRTLNQHMAQEAAARYASYSERLEKRYETNPTSRLADIMDAQARFAVMDKNAANAIASEFLSGTKKPRSEYEILEALKRVPKHALAEEYAKRGDFAMWTQEGQDAHDDMKRFALMGDKIAFQAEDGSHISAAAEDVYSPPEYTARDMAERHSTVDKTFGDSSVSLPAGY